MSRTKRRGLALLVLVWAACDTRQRHPTESASHGVVVEELQPGRVNDGAGFQVGDVLLSWERAHEDVGSAEALSGLLHDPFSYLELIEEQVPRGEVRLHALRAGRRFQHSLDHNDVGFAVRPQLAGGFLEAYTAARRQLREGRPRQSDGTEADPEALEGTRALRRLAETAEAAGDARDAIFFVARAGQGLRDLGYHGEALVEFQEALRLAEHNEQPAVLTWVRMEIANSLLRSSGSDEAVEHYSAALELRRQLYGDSLSVANTLNNLGVAKQNLGDDDDAGPLHRQALEIRERLAPDSLEVTQSLSNLAKLASRRGDLESAEREFLRILEIRREKAPDSVELAHAYNNVGVVSVMRGDRAAAEAAMLQALALWRRLAPRTAPVSIVLQNLAMLATDRGDLKAAERYYRDAMDIDKQRSPDGLRSANLLGNLASLARTRGDLEAAKRNYLRALRIREQRSPGSLDVAMALTGLADVAHDEGDFEEAQRYLHQGLEIRRGIAADSLEVARSLLRLGQVSRRLGRLDEAEDYLEQSAAIAAEKAPGDNFFTAVSRRSLGSVAFDRGDLETAERYFSEALGIWRRIAPESRREAIALHQLGCVDRESGRLEEARRHFELAVEALESQAGKLGGSDETRSAFRSRHREIYQDLIELLVKLGHDDQAFHMLERSRARGLLDMLAERDLLFDLDLPADLERRRRRIGVRYDQVQDRLAKLSPSQGAEAFDAHLRQLEELRQQRQEVRDEVLRLAPRLAALHDPKPLDVAGVRRILDAGTVALSYSVGASQSLLFVLARDSLEVMRLDFGEAEIRRRIGQLRLLLEQPGSGVETLVDISSALYQDLIGPAMDTVEEAERLLVVPDGQLHTLPFGVLVQPDGGRYLIESKPLHVVASLTVYGELRKKPDRRPGASTLAAFGDPIDSSAGDAASSDSVQSFEPSRSPVPSGGFAPLMASRDEVRAIVALYGASARAYLGPEATETHVKAVDRDIHVLHFATHAVIDERFPLDSGLVLSSPAGPLEGGDNGLLQAWEIFEEIRLDADLVTLSACESAMGKEVAGEGLMGLTRAFQYAGARTVVASLWRVADQSTAALMTRFYGYLRAGRSKDEALRRAQLDLIRESVRLPSTTDRLGFWDRLFSRGETRRLLDASHPYHWAAFQVFGDRLSD